MKKRIRILALSLVFTMGLALAACGGGGAPTESDKETKPEAGQSDPTSSESVDDSGDEISGTLTFLSWNNESIMQPLLDIYSSYYPDVKIDFIFAPPVQDYIEKFQMMYSTGDLPDVFVTAAENKLEVMDNNIALDISYLPAFDRLSDKNRETYSRDGKTYAFAPDGWIAGIFFNKGMLADNGIDIPTNRKEYLDSMKTLRENGINPWAFSSTNLYDPVQGYVATETVENDSAYDEKVNNNELKYSDGWTTPIELWVSDYLEPGNINDDALGLTGDQVNEMFALEECAYIIGATWSASTINELNPDLDFGMLPWFGTKDGVAWMTGAAGVGWSINANAKNMPAAKAMLEVLSGDEALTKFQELTGGLLAIDGIEFPIHEAIAEGYPYMLEGKYYLPAVEWKYSDALGKEMLTGTQEVIAGNMEASQIVENMDKKHAELETERG